MIRSMAYEKGSAKKTALNTRFYCFTNEDSFRLPPHPFRLSANPSLGIGSESIIDSNDLRRSFAIGLRRLLQIPF